ncbi:ceramidase-domain-containing protein [Bisporella sp. PMI_857]|nr:ceramidase-domain-containing protein [Bisporella sp. PMI_857]
MGLSIPYRDIPKTPYWGPANSSADFCEEDYIITEYIAEFINTLTSATYVYYAYYSIKQNKNRKDALLRNFPYLGLAGVGFGSAIFHATLKTYTQWGDDLSMLIATATTFHRLFTFDRSLRTTVISGTLGAIFMSLFIAWHCYEDEIIVHRVLFGIMIITVGQKTRGLINALPPSSSHSPRRMRRLATAGAVFFGTGFTLWNIDNEFCGILTAWKREVGMPWSWVLELHGWWHFLTGIGSYIFMKLVEDLTATGDIENGEWAWPLKAMGRVERRTTSAPNGKIHHSGNGHLSVDANGTSKQKKLL